MALPPSHHRGGTLLADGIITPPISVASAVEGLRCLQRTVPIGDTQFVVMEKFLSNDNDLPFYERVIMKFYFWIKENSLSEEKGFGLDQSNVVTEKFPLLINPAISINLKRKKQVM